MASSTMGGGGGGMGGYGATPSFGVGPGLPVMHTRGLPVSGGGFGGGGGGGSGKRVPPETLPPVWARATDAAGRPYFMNHALKTTVWELPTERFYKVDVREGGPLGLELA